MELPSPQDGVRVWGMKAAEGGEQPTPGDELTHVDFFTLPALNQTLEQASHGQRFQNCSEIRGLAPDLNEPPGWWTGKKQSSPCYLPRVEALIAALLVQRQAELLTGKTKDF